MTKYPTALLTPTPELLPSTTPLSHRGNATVNPRMILLCAKPKPRWPWHIPSDKQHLDLLSLALKSQRERVARKAQIKAGVPAASYKATPSTPRLSGRLRAGPQAEVEVFVGARHSNSAKSTSQP
jgi:hypothetical protein